MPQTTQGSVSSLWRYPVKSMVGEELTATEVTEQGLLGDRAYAVVDCGDGKAATAKNPRKWPTLFAFRAAFVEPPRSTASLPPVRITLPDGSAAMSQQRDIDRILSHALNRSVTLTAAPRNRAIEGGLGPRTSVPGKSAARFCSCVATRPASSSA